MTSQVLFGAGLIMLFVVWKYMIQPTLIDHFRDKLFDLRDSVREHFLQRGELGSPEYRQLRDLLNSHILYIEKATLFAFLHLVVTSKKDPETTDAFNTTRRGKLSDDPEVNKFRRAASDIVVQFATHGSLVVWLVALVGAPFVVIYEVTVAIIKRSVKALPKVDFARAIEFLFRSLGLVGGRKPSMQAVIERASRDYVRRETLAKSIVANA
jgi:hypothetical protein